MIFWRYLIPLQRQSHREGSIIDLLRSPNIRKKTLNISFCWYVLYHSGIITYLIVLVCSVHSKITLLEILIEI